MASLAFSALLTFGLTAPAAHAGSYTDVQSGDKTPATVTPAADATPAPPAPLGPYDAVATSAVTPYSPDGDPTYTIKVNPGAITDTFTWTHGKNPDGTTQTDADDPPPACVLVEQTSSATWFVRMENGTGTGSGQADPGLSGGTVTTGTYGQANGPSSALRAIFWSQKSGSSFSASCSPTASFMGTTGADGSVGGEATVSGGATVYPITLTVGGTKKDSGGGDNILVGQQATATVNGIPSNLLPYATFDWSGITGTTFESWTVSSDQSHTTEVDATPATNPTQWYWNDLKGANETVQCKVTVTPPANLGNSFSFTVTAPKQVSVQVPGWTATGTGGNVQVNTTCVGLNGTISLHAGATHGTSHRGGMDFHLTVDTPTTPAFGTGQLELVQIITPNDSYTTNTTPVQSHSDPLDSKTGVDGQYPYTGVATSETNSLDPDDSPNLPLQSTTASATVTPSFTDYLMYEPPNSTQFVALATFTWSVNGSASTTSSGNPPVANWAGYAALNNGSDNAGTVSAFGSSSPNTAVNFKAPTTANTFPSWTQILVAKPY